MILIQTQDMMSLVEMHGLSVSFNSWYENKRKEDMQRLDVLKHTIKYKTIWGLTNPGVKERYEEIYDYIPATSEQIKDAQDDYKRIYKKMKRYESYDIFTGDCFLGNYKKKKRALQILVEIKELFCNNNNNIVYEMPKK